MKNRKVFHWKIYIQSSLILCYPNKVGDVRSGGLKVCLLDSGWNDATAIPEGIAKFLIFSLGKANQGRPRQAS